MRNFKDSEFLCKDGCGGGIEKMDMDFLLILDKMRDFTGIPLTLVSAYRCLKHNAAVGSRSTNHFGWAVDIKCLSSQTRYKIIKSALKAGITRIGVHKKFIHLDCNPKEAPEVVWFY